MLSLVIWEYYLEILFQEYFRAKYATLKVQFHHYQPEPQTCTLCVVVVYGIILWLNMPKRIVGSYFYRNFSLLVNRHKTCGNCSSSWSFVLVCLLTATTTGMCCHTSTLRRRAFWLTLKAGVLAPHQQRSKTEERSTYLSLQVLPIQATGLAYIPLQLRTFRELLLSSTNSQAKIPST